MVGARGSLTSEVNSRGACRLSHSAFGQALAMPASATGAGGKEELRRGRRDWGSGTG